LPTRTRRCRGTSFSPDPRPASVNFQHVDQRVTLVTLGVSDYARAKAFYAALGWRPAFEAEETAFFQGNGIILALWGREKLGPDLGIPDDGARWSGMSLAQNVRSQEEVHAVIEQARENGAQITREPSDTFYGGYAGAFRDLDGHAWEIAHNPGFGLDDDGNIVLPGA
jgi:predicted lactoylglutathione lyase